MTARSPWRVLHSSAGFPQAACQPTIILLFPAGAAQLRYSACFKARQRLYSSAPQPVPHKHSSRSAFESSHSHQRQTTESVLRSGSSSSAVSKRAIDRAAANPPASTRPPPLDLPERDANASLFQHLFRTGKAYLRFYKTGLYQIVTNVKLTWALRGEVDDLVNLTPSSTPTSTSEPSSSSSSSSPASASKETPSPPRPGTRAAALLERRTSHDLRRLPVFGLVLLVCGEFTPLVALAAPQLVPLTCRLPPQVRKLQRAQEARRDASFTASEAGLAEALARPREASGRDEAGLAGDSIVTGHVCRSLGLAGGLWNRIGIPPALAKRWACQGVKSLAVDDMRLASAGGVEALEPDEVRLACVDRGMDVLERDDETLRNLLSKWLGITAQELNSKEGGTIEREEDIAQARIWTLLCQRPEQWRAR
jgi:hypothetical protein